jgi:hypothetical protein
MMDHLSVTVRDVPTHPHVAGCTDGTDGQRKPVKENFGEVHVGRPIWQTLTFRQPGFANVEWATIVTFYRFIYLARGF